MRRTDLTQLIEAALAAKHPGYARQVAERHLADWPGDLGVQLALANALAAEGHAARAIDILEAVVAVDPEDSAAQRALAGHYVARDRRPEALHAYSSAHVADGHGIPGAPPAWTEAARAAFLSERVGDWATAQREALVAAQAAPDSALAMLLNMAAYWHAGQLHLARPMAEAGLARWPKVAAFKLCLAECLLAAGDQPRGIQLLHEAAAADASGQVVARHWGANHAYRSLWDMHVAVTLPGPLPAELVSMLGLNRLGGQGESAPHGKAQHGLPTEVEEIAEIQAQLDALAARLPSRVTLKHRLRKVKKSADQPSAPSGQPAYVVVSSRTRLIQVFGMDGFTRIDAALRDLMTRTAKRTAFKPCLLYVDDPGSLSPYGLRPANPANAWEVKSLIGKLDGRLKTLNSTIGAILIVGGADIIPFHHLPNPTDDIDPDIPSDNPYATADDNYFVPEWPIGRLPTGAGTDPAPLLHAIQLAAGGPSGPAANVTLPGLFTDWLLAWWLSRFGPKTFGYSANVWRGASVAVYTSIGDPKELLTSPPIDANALPVEGLAPSRLSYFNLHGVEDGPEWYGQRTLEDPATLPEYPVALRPADVTNSGRAPVFVFSEACYGANIVGKNVEDALCLKFLNSGTRAMVASTKIAYGSVNTPLIGADLLGRCFWQNVNQGLPAGEALRRAKLQMAQDMTQRQSFLDGEDQKTLISFVLYGDPLAQAPAIRRYARPSGKSISLPKLRRPVTVCDKTTGKAAAAPHQLDLSTEQVAQIKSAVARYLPGMQDAEMHIARTHAECSGADHSCPTAQLSPQSKTSAPPSGTRVVTLSKTIRVSSRAHPHYARLTLNETGEVIKVAVSR